MEVDLRNSGPSVRSRSIPLIKSVGDGVRWPLFLIADFFASASVRCRGGYCLFGQCFWRSDMAITQLLGWVAAPDPVASRPPGRTGVCRESRGAPSAPGLVSGFGFRSPNPPDRGRNPTYRAGSRREVWCERSSCYHHRQLAGAIWGISVQMFAENGTVNRKHKNAIGIIWKIHSLDCIVNCTTHNSFVLEDEGDNSSH